MKFDHEYRDPTIKIIVWILAISLLVIYFFSCKSKERYVITTDDSIDTISTFNYIDILGLKCIHYTNRDGTEVAYHTYKLDTIQ
jgi:hypothetical protein